MARKDQLRRQRAGTVINVTSKKQESDIVQALYAVVDDLTAEFGTQILRGALNNEHYSAAA